MSTDWPAGLAHAEVVVQLFNKYSPNDQNSKVELRSMLNEVSMKDSEDPSTLFEKVSAIQNCYDTDADHIEEEELIAVIIGAAPEKYLSVITCEQRAKGDQMSLQDLEIVMYQLWCQSKGLIDQHITLAAFEGYCYKCKQQGHKADACPTPGAKKKDGAKASNSTGRSGRGGRGNGRDGT
jgi:hypothetical protein